ncbi:acetyltransferase (GNAT) family protein [Tamaricihabitans halophyticus]|uniref:Acetyltransferase (GNAT) family protein n=2 Tax=Tamaricihabitans halophyticus TaxID=1262583 RepID=A0A4R2QX22_9PSEU|nr:acetyltransferase (GNAT) family protein [Tamaricihabitans halophyticus]
MVTSHGDAGLVRGLQERVAAAQPAEQVRRLGDWWLRYTETSSWWVGTVLPHGTADRAELPELISAAEHFYVSRGAVPRFQLSPGACPAELDDMLAARGYRRSGPVSLRTAHTAEILARARPTGLDAQLAEFPSQEWFAVGRAIHGNDPAAEQPLLARNTQQSAFVSVRYDDEVIAVGRAAVDTGWAGVFGMATLPRARGMGAASAALGALASWAEARATGSMYLQVEAENETAVRLYTRMGFTELCEYHYRTAPAADR